MAKKTNWDGLVNTLRKAQGIDERIKEDEITIDESIDDYNDEDAFYDEEDESEYIDDEPELEKANVSLDEIKMVLQGIVDRLNGIEKTQKSLHKSLKKPFHLKSITSAHEIGNRLRKSGAGLKHKPFTIETMREAMSLMRENGVDAYRCAAVETQMNKSIGNPNYQLSKDNINLLLSLSDKEGK